MYLGLFHHLGMDVDSNLVSLKNLVMAEHAWGVVGDDDGFRMVCQVCRVWHMYPSRPP